MPHIMYTVFSLILYAPKQITHVQTIISEHDRNGAKWEVGHIAIYLTKRDGGGELGHGVWGKQRQREASWERRSDSVCMCVCVCVCVCVCSDSTWKESDKLIQELLGQ